jgi:NADH-quinone oxidoreductase subunit M
MFQMLAHGISSAGMFFMVGVLYDRVHHRNLEEFGGIFNRMPVYSGLAIAVFFAGLGLPGLCGFIGEVLVTLSSWNYSRTLAAISAFTVILTAAYILWAIQRVYLGAEYKGPHGDHLTPITGRELAIAAPLVFFAILFGVAPQLIFNYVTPSVNRQVETLADWTRDVGGKAVQPVAGGPAAADVTTVR